MTAGATIPELPGIIKVSASVTASSGKLTVHGSSYGTNVIAGSGAADIWGGSGYNHCTYHKGDGLITVEDFSNRDTLIVDSSLKAGMTTTTVSGGVTLHFANSPGCEILLKGQTSTVPSHITWI